MKTRFTKTSQGREPPAEREHGPAGRRLAGQRELPHVSAGVALDEDLLLLFLAGFVLFFRTVITFSRAGLLPELRATTNRPFLTTCYGSSPD